MNVLLRNLRSARRGVAPGPSGTTADHFKVLLDDADVCDMFADLCKRLLGTEAPEAIVQALRLGRVTALRKSDGGVKGIVAGDIVRRHVARTAPYHYALRTRACTECPAHALQAMTNLDEEATVLSIDGVGAFNTMSREAMPQALADLLIDCGILQFVKLWYGLPSRYVGEDDSGQSFEVAQGEEGEQGDALMPLLHALRQHRALQAINSRVGSGARLFAFLDDICVLARPGGIVTIYNILEEELRNHARIGINVDEALVWNRDSLLVPGSREEAARPRQRREESRSSAHLWAMRTTFGRLWRNSWLSHVRSSTASPRFREPGPPGSCCCLTQRHGQTTTLLWCALRYPLNKRRSTTKLCVRAFAASSGSSRKCPLPIRGDCPSSLSTLLLAWASGRASTSQSPPSGLHGPIRWR